jgi:hypothetical protein
MTDHFDPERWEALNEKGAVLRVRLALFALALGVLLSAAVAIGFLN